MKKKRSFLFNISFPSSHFQTQQNSSVVSNMLPGFTNTSQLINGPTQFLMRPPSPPVINISDAGLAQSLSLGNAFPSNLSMGNTLPPQVIYKPNNQEINYKQNVMIRWLKPPTPPPAAPIIIRG
jgi:hypothetical protein